MARLVKHERDRPYVINANSGESFAVCACGLSKSKPLCDGSHKHARDEEPNALYVYDETGRAKLIQHYPNPTVPSNIPLLHEMKQLE